MTTSKSSPTDVVVVDGSNIATEGRSMPSLTQLNDAVMAFKEEHPDAIITVVVDATFGHRIDKKEAKEFDLAVAHNEVVAPPAGAIGRGDAFVLSIANKVGARILSNDSFQEFHGDYPWLFDEGRLIGGKPVPYVGWVFVERLPVKGPVSRKSQRAARGSRGEPKAARRSASREASQPMPVPTAPPPGAARRAAEPREQPVAPHAAPPVTATTGAPVNDVLTFLDFVEHHPVGSSVNGVVDSYSSHGAYVKVGELRGYVPLRLMSDPPPRSAREVMHIGDAVTLVVASFAPARRSVDLTVPHMAPGAAVVPTPGVEVIAEVLTPELDRQPAKRTAKKAAAVAEEPAPAAAPAKRAGRTKAAAVAEEPAATAPAPAKRAGRKKAALPPHEVAPPTDAVMPTKTPPPPVAPAPPDGAPATRPTRKAPATKATPAPAATKKAPAKKGATKKAPAAKATTPPPPEAEPERPAPAKKAAPPKKAPAKKAAAKKTASPRPTMIAGLPADAAEPVTTDGDAPAPVKRSRARKATASPVMRFATWNVNSLKVRQDRIETWLGDISPDVVCMQETKLADSAFPQLTFEALGYTAVHHGEGRWNGVAVLSRRGVDDVSFGFADGQEPDSEARLMTARVEGITIVNVYVPNGRALDADHYQYKLRWLDRLAAHVDAVAPDGGSVIVAGDFNIAPTDVDVYDPAVFAGATHVSPPERERLQALLDRGLTDVFRHSYPDATRAFSWWDYRRGDFHEGRGMRIDLVLASAPVVDRVEWMVIDRNARKGQQPSDHAPVVVDLRD